MDVKNNTRDIIAVDTSGSTNGNVAYYNTVSEYIKKIYQSNKDTIFYGWTDVCIRLTYEQLTNIVDQRKGSGATNPTCLVDFIYENDNLTIFTDGQIEEKDVRTCDGLFKKRRLSNVVGYVIDTRKTMSYDEPDMSSIVPFTRQCAKFDIYYNGKLERSGSTVSSLDCYKGRPDKFIAEIKQIEDNINIKYMGTNDPQIRVELLDLQKNLIASIGYTKMHESADLIATLQQRVAVDYKSSIEAAKKIVYSCGDSMISKIKTCFNELLSMCDDNTDFSFSQKKRKQTSRELRANKTEEMPLGEAAVYTEEEFTGTTTVNDETMGTESKLAMIPIIKGEPIFNNIPSYIIESISSNPMNLLNYKEIKDKTKSRLGHLQGTDTVIGIINHNDVFKVPESRAEVSKFLVFGGSHPVHVKTNIDTLAKLFFGEKLVGQLEVWMSVIYLLIREVEFLLHQDGLLALCEEYLVKILNNKMTSITLSGLPIAPLVKTSMSLAYWFVLNTPFVHQFEEFEDERNRLRSLGKAAVEGLMVIVCDVLKYKIDREGIMFMVNCYQAFSIMMRQDSNYEELVRALYQNHIITSTGCIIFLDGSVKQIQVFAEHCGLSREAIYALSLKVDKKISANSISIPVNYDYSSVKLPTAVKHYDCYPDVFDIKDFPHIELLETICRPRTYDREEKKHWTVCAEEWHGSLNKQLSMYRYMIDFIAEYKKYPTKEEYILFMATKLGNKETKNGNNRKTYTLPMNITNYVDIVYEEHENLFKKFTPEKYNAIAQRSRNREIRITLE